MLNLMRRPREAVVIVCPDGTRLEITVQRIEGNQVKLSFDAPTSFVIDRYEVQHRKAREAAGVPKTGQEPRGPHWVPFEDREQEPNGNR